VQHCSCDGISDGTAFTNRPETASARDFSNKAGADPLVCSDNRRQLLVMIFGIDDGIDPHDQAETPSSQGFNRLVDNRGGI
jgi:hypothetical protein